MHPVWNDKTFTWNVFPELIDLVHVKSFSFILAMIDWNLMVLMLKLLLLKLLLLKLLLLKLLLLKLLLLLPG